MYELKKIGKVFTSKFVGTGPSSYKKRIYRAAVSQRLRNTGLGYRLVTQLSLATPIVHTLIIYQHMPARGLSDREDEGTKHHQESFENLKFPYVNSIVPGLENSCSTSAYSSYNYVGHMLRR